MTDINGFNSDTTFQDGLNSDSIHDLGNTVNIELSNNTINLVASSVLVNNVPIGAGGGGIQNPLTSNLDISTFNIVSTSSGLSLNTINLKTQNIASVSAGLTNFSGTIESSAFKTIGATSQQYTMGDGSLLNYSSNSGNSNFYLYKNNTNLSPTPVAGDISYNTEILQIANFVYISHRTRDNIDIDIYFKNLSQSSEVYIQDQNSSANFIQYNIIGTPTITPEAYVAIPVQFQSAGGDGYNNFANSHNLILSFFQNGIEIDSRLSTLETKTQFQTVSSLTTNLASSLSINDGILTTPMTNTAQTKNFVVPFYDTLGFKFTTSVPITINKIGSDISQWVVPADRILKIYAEGNTTALYAFTIPLINIYGLYYVLDVNITLPAGTYRLGIDSFANTWYNTTPLVFDSRITNVFSALAAGTPSVYPNIIGTSPNVVYAGMFWIQDNVQSNLTLNSSVNLNGISNIDIMSFNRPCYGIRYVHSSTGVPTNDNNASFTALGSTAAANAVYAVTNNFTRQIGCASWAFPTPGDGQQCGFTSTAATGVQVSKGGEFGLTMSLGYYDTTYSANNPQNFFGLWNAAAQIGLNSTVQLSVQRNMICIGSNSTDSNLCIYTAGVSSTVKQVNLGASFPSNRILASPSTDWFHLGLYWDGISRMYYKAVNTTLNITIEGSFVPLDADFPLATVSLFPQCVRVMGSPSISSSCKLKVQRFAVF